MPLINSIISWFNVKRLHQIELFKKYPGNVQRETFNRLIRQAADTEWGKKYHYREIENINQYQARVPIQTYEDIVPYVDRQRAGEQNVLWPTEIKWYAKSSGTTAEKSKFLPVSKEALEECHFRGSKDVLALYTSRFPDSLVLRGKALTLGGSHQINNYSTQSYYGDLSAILIENLPFWANFIRTPSAEVALIPDFEEKVEKITKVAIKENVTNIAGVPSWNLVLLKHILDATGNDNLLDIWPNLELFTHGGVSFAPYRDQFRKIIPSENMHYMETYNASEGFFGIQDDLSDSSMLLMLDYGVFYEFIPMDRFNETHPPAYTINEVQTGVNYAIVISTNGGLWRYMIGDTIVFTSLTPHKFRITGRTKYFINAFGEEVILENAENALMTACRHTGAQIKDYTAGPIYMTAETLGSHEWLIEFEKLPDDLERFTDVLDKTLCSINSDYEAKRYKNTTLVKPSVTAVPDGTFYQWFQQKGKVGGQNKMPRLSNDRKYLDEVRHLIS
ncbi:MAG: GH3 auxin-responsive promoter family protein [Bacteroidales bacterium]|nr:GH3 auxin-responsive promoter family protein [Bacteroidales bacterium]